MDFMDWDSPFHSLLSVPIAWVSITPCFLDLKSGLGMQVRPGPKASSFSWFCPGAFVQTASWAVVLVRGPRLVSCAMSP
jgi:hypothetical protein